MKIDLFEIYDAVREVFGDERCRISAQLSTERKGILEVYLERDKYAKVVFIDLELASFAKFDYIKFEVIESAKELKKMVYLDSP